MLVKWQPSPLFPRRSAYARLNAQLNSLNGHPMKPHGVTETNHQPRPFTITPFSCVLSQVSPQKTWAGNQSTATWLASGTPSKPQDCPQYPIIARCLLFKGLPHASPIHGKPELALIPPSLHHLIPVLEGHGNDVWKLLLMGAVGFVLSCAQQK